MGNQQLSWPQRGKLWLRLGIRLVLAALAWLSCAGGIAAWTVLFFKGAHKVKLFPMYPVDLNLDM